MAAKKKKKRPSAKRKTAKRKPAKKRPTKSAKKAKRAGLAKARARLRAAGI